MQALFDQINAVGPAVRRIVASGGLSVPVPTSEEQQHHSDQAPDAVTLFTFASNEAIEAAWKMSNEDWRREEARLGRHPTDRRQVNQVLFPGEIKGGPKAGAAARQILRRFYRLKSTVALREFVYGFTLAVDRFRVLCHMPGGIVQTNEFNCSRPEGFKVLLRFLVRLVVDTELNLGAIVSGAAYPLTVNTLPPFVYQRPTSAGSAANVHHRARLWAPTNRKDAMTGNRTAYYPAAVEKDGATASYRRSPEQTVAFSFPTSEQSKRTICLLERLDTFHSTTIEGLATVETIYQDPQAFRTAPPDVCGGDAGCLSGGVTSRTTQFIEYRELYQSILQAQSTHHLTQLILDAVKGVRSLYQIDVLHRDLSIENLVIKPDGTGALMLSDCFCFLDDALSEQERLEAVGTLATMARAMLPTNKSRIKHEIWHEIEQLVFDVLYVISSRPLGPNNPTRMSREDEKTWRNWDRIVPTLAILKSVPFRSRTRWRSQLERYKHFWTDIDQLVQVLIKYCELGMVSETTTIAEEEVALFAEWGGRDGATRLLDQLVHDLEMLASTLALQNMQLK